MKKVFPIAVVVGIIVLLVMTLIRYPSGKDEKEIASLQPKPSHQMTMVLANTPELWKRGLKGYPEPDDSHGMMFDFGKVSRQCVTNKDIPYAIDVGFYDEQWHLLGGATMQANAKNPVCFPIPIRYMVELRGGWFAAHSKK